MWEPHETACRSDGGVLTSIVRRPDLYFFMSWSAVDEAALLVKDVIDPTTGHHLAFVCTACCTPFLHPSAATDDWLARTWSSPVHPTRPATRQRQVLMRTFWRRKSWTL